jgi:SAM-dependent methyltransferase
MPAAYDQYDYSDYWHGREYEHESEVIALKAFLGRIPKIQSIIDLGCGYGRLTPYYSFRAKKIVLTDPSLKLLSEAKKNNQNNQKIKYIQSRLETLPDKLHRKTFDLAILVRVLHHIEDPNQAFEAIDKILEPGGYLILEFANKIHWKEIGKNFLKGDFTYPLDIFPQDKRSAKSQRKKTIPFLNFHPDIIRHKLEERKYKILEIRSVSNVRWGYLKKHMPLPFLLWLEDLLQIPFSLIHFGPSIFILARKS